MLEFFIYKIYADRKEVTREEVDGSVHASNSGANQLRSIFGMNVQVGSTTMDAEIFLPLMKIEEGLPVGILPWDNKGCQKSK